VGSNGCHFAQVPNNLALAWARLHLSPVEASVVLVLQTRTLGAYDPTRRRAGCRDTNVSERELAELTGWRRQRVHEALKRLVDSGVVYRVDRGHDGKGRRASRLGLCLDPRILSPSDVAATADVDDAPAPDLEALTRDMSPQLRAATVKARGVAARAGVPQSLVGGAP
jgi:DNA-binding transcriptional MocR family regulator